MPSWTGGFLLEGIVGPRSQSQTQRREECLRAAAVVYVDALHRIMYTPLHKAAQGDFSDGLTVEERMQDLFQHRRKKFIAAGATDGPDLWQYIVDGDSRYFV